MSQTLEQLGIDRLSVTERINLIQDIWQSISSEIPATNLTSGQQQELRKRAAEHQSNPDDVVSWEEIKADAMERFAK